MSSAISILMIVCLWCASLNVSVAEFFYPKHGLVVGKTTVLDPDSGQPILVVVNEKGEEVSDLGPRVSPLDTMSIWNADGYRADAAAYAALLNELPSEVTKNHCIIELERYGIDHCGDAYVTVSTAGGDPELVAIEYPDQYSGAPGMLIRSIANAKYVVLRHSSTIVDPRLLGSDGPVLLVSRIDLNNLDRSVISDTSVRSLLLTEEGRVHYSTEHNITYRTGYFKPTDEYDENRASPSLDDDKERALGPIAGAKVTSNHDTSGEFSNTTDEGGEFRVEYSLPPCPCSSRHYSGHLLAEIPYRNFNPLNSDRLPFASFFASTPTYDFCSGYHYCIFGSGLIGQMLQSSVAGIHASSAAGSFRNDIKFDAMIITGEGQLLDAQGAVIEVGETRYATEQQGTFENENPNILGFDFDLDRQPDQAVLHEDEYFIYLGGRVPEFDESSHPINEDLRRRPDQINDYQDRGLLESISIEDLKQTDLYIYRVSTGELLVERQNLRPEEPVRLSDGGIDESSSESLFFYRQMMRGPHYDFGIPGGPLKHWWSEADIRLELFDRNQADFLRMGESVQIIAINRPTGYIGSVTAVLQFNTESDRNTLDVPIGKLLLRPPNLKIRAERRTQTELGLTKGEIKDYLIGSEGSGLTGDQYIIIKTEWFDHDGRPLPSDLPGYSGILAKLVGSQKLGSDNACTSSIDPISIEPGSRIQLLKLGDNCGLGTEHYYVYVCGHYESDSARSKCFSFGQTNDIGRPSYYVPVQVPFYNEFASREAYKRYRYGLEDGVIEAGRDAPEPVYEWFYRPEMQFSVFDLDIDEINRVSLSQEGDVDTINLIEDESPVISSSDDSIDVFYSLLDPKYAPLPMFGPDRELVLALGEHEVQLKIGTDNKVSFDNLESLGQLNPEDFLGMRLYANNDAANILWKWTKSPDFQVIPRSLVEGTGVHKRRVESDIEDTFFFPALGNKKVFVKNTGEAFYSGRIAIISVEDDIFETVPAVDEYVDLANINKFLFKGGQTVIPDSNYPDKTYEVIFRIVFDNDIDPITKRLSVTIKTNSNTSLQELLDGQAIWYKGALDNQATDSQKAAHKGLTSGGTPDKRFIDYGQYLMNMVAIPLIEEVKETNLAYAITPDGDFGAQSRLMLQSFMDHNARDDIPTFTNERYVQGAVISHFDTDTGAVTDTTTYRSLRKLLQDYQALHDETIDNVDAENDKNSVNSLNFADYRYAVMTPEVIRGLDYNNEQGRTIAVDGDFIDDDLGLYEMYLSYDWDGDGLSNLAEVENCLNGDYRLDLFNPLSADNNTATDYDDRLLTAYNRGGWGVKLDRTNGIFTPTGSGLAMGEISGTDGQDIAGLRIPTFAPGIYDLGGREKNIDSYTTLPMVQLLEAVGRAWAITFPDTAPLETDPTTHSITIAARTGQRRIGINDISARAGGFNSASYLDVIRQGRVTPQTNLAHSTHHNGLDIDMRFVANTEIERAIDLDTDRSHFDVDATGRLLLEISKQAQQFGLTPRAMYVGQDDKELPDSELMALCDCIGLKTNCSHSIGHDNHIHLSFSNGKAEEVQATTDAVEDIDITYQDGGQNSYTYFEVFTDSNNNAILPWHLITFTYTVRNAANKEVIRVRSLHPIARQQTLLWVNDQNEANFIGQARLKITCMLGDNTSYPIQLRNALDGNAIIKTLNVTCATPAGN